MCFYPKYLVFLISLKELETMSDHVQESVDVCTINWKDDEASREGTQALRYLVQSLHDAQANPSLQPMVQALKRSNNILPPNI